MMSMLFLMLPLGLHKIVNYVFTPWQGPSFVISSPPTSIAAMEFRSGFLAKPWTDLSTSKTQLLKYSLAQSSLALSWVMNQLQNPGPHIQRPQQTGSSVSHRPTPPIRTVPDTKMLCSLSPIQMSKLLGPEPLVRRFPLFGTFSPLTSAMPHLWTTQNKHCLYVLFGKHLWLFLFITAEHRIQVDDGCTFSK